VNARDLTHDQLVGALSRTPNLTPTGQAARQVILESGFWLHRADFIDAIDIEVWAGVIYARVDWAKATPIAAADSDPHQVALLRFALLLSGAFTTTPAPWTLRDVLATIHWDHARTVMAAVATALSGDRV
jgi:hypothetical protein